MKRRSVKVVVVVLAVMVLAAAGFFVWASSGVLPDGALATVTVYEAPAAAPRDTLTVMTYNIGYLSGATNNRAVPRPPALFSQNLETTVEMLSAAQPDVVAFQEIDFGAARSYGVQQLDTLARRGGFHAGAAAVNWDERYVPFPGSWPGLHFGRVLSGQAVLSRYPVRAHKRIALERAPTPFYYDAFYLDRLAQVVEIDVGQPLVIINVHLEAFDAATRRRQAAAVLGLYRRYRAEAPVILLGDFNSLLPAARATFAPEDSASFAGDRTLDLLLADPTLREAFPESAVQAQDPSLFTYHTENPTVKIDHIFYDATRLTQVEAYVVAGPAPPSDHRAVVMRFVMRGE